VQDVPRRTAPPPAPDARTPDFGAQFEGVLKALNVESALRTFRMNGVGAASLLRSRARR
jgi:hypothetical protein